MKINLKTRQNCVDAFRFIKSSSTIYHELGRNVINVKYSESLKQRHLETKTIGYEDCSYAG